MKVHLLLCSYEKVRWFWNVFFVSSISSKKWMKTSCMVVKSNSFVRFLEKFAAWQFAFGPLVKPWAIDCRTQMNAWNKRTNGFAISRNLPQIGVHILGKILSSHFITMHYFSERIKTGLTFSYECWQLRRTQLSLAELATYVLKKQCDASSPAASGACFSYNFYNFSGFTFFKI